MVLSYSHSARVPDGTVLRDNGDGTVTEADTRQCCHCGKHFVWRAGSGTIRGQCLLCSNPGKPSYTCGDPKCHEHFPIEERMDLYEKGLLPSLDASRDQAKVKRTINS